MNELYKILKDAIDSAEKVQKAISKKQQDIRDAKLRNRIRIKENAMVERGSIAATYHPAEEFEDVDKLRKQNVIENSYLSAPMALAEAMLKYSLVKTNMNSVNVHGNQSSDVLNSSLITRLKAIFEDTDKGETGALALLAADYHLDTNTQFRFSNILI